MTEGTALEIGKTCYARVMDRRFLVTVLGLSDDTVWVSFPGAHYPIAGMGVDLEVHDVDGFACYHTRVVIGPGNKGDGMVLQRSGGIHHLKHRRSWRVPTDFPARFHLSGSHRICQGSLLNLSAEGALMETETPLDIGETIMLTFTLPDCDPCTLAARVIREDQPAPAGPRRFALWFTEVAPETRRVLTLFLWRRIREQYPQALRRLFGKA